MKESDRHRTGSLGEKRACEYLREKGYIIIETNYRFMRGEIDIIASTDRELVFIEVKSRTSSHFGFPEESVDTRKRKQLFKVAEAWIHERKMTGSPVRFDVISILHPAKPEEQISHIEGAFWRL
ncbi:YraN family protein [Balneolaceae bacterium ANBcel3]|nr:YraN family protein [Balneolaceae bacterium ANBcel3]